MGKPIKGRKGEVVSIITWRKWRDGLELASQALLRCPALSAAAGPPCQSPTSCEGVGMANSRKIAKAIFLIEWHPPQAALRRRCPARGFGVDVGTAHTERGKGRRCPVPATKHKTGGAGLGPGESSEGRSDAAWLAGETAGYPAKVPFRRPLVWRFCQKGRIVLDIRWKKGYSKEEFWQEANGKARMLSQVERDRCFENST